MSQVLPNLQVDEVKGRAAARQTRLPRTILLAMCACASLTLAAQSVGLQLYSLRNELKSDLGASLDSLQSWGVHHVEDGNDGTYGLPFQEYKALLGAHEIEMVSVSAPFEELRDKPKDVAARAKAYGAKFAVVFWLPHADSIMTLTEANAAIAVLNKAGVVLAAEGVSLLYHPHGYEFGVVKGKRLILDHIVRESRSFDFEMDVYWIALPGQDPMKWLKRYPKEWKLFHLKDCQRGVPPGLPHRANVEHNVVLGTGQFDIAPVIRWAQKRSIPFLFVEDESSKVMQQAPASIRWVRAVLAGTAGK